MSEDRVNSLRLNVFCSWFGFAMVSALVMLWLWGCAARPCVWVRAVLLVEVGRPPFCLDLEPIGWILGPDWVQGFVFVVCLGACPTRCPISHWIMLIPQDTISLLSTHFSH